MKFAFAAIAVSSIFALQAAAHGYLESITIDGTKHKGNDPTSGKIIDSAIRRISSQDPNYGATRPHIVCGPNAKPGKLIANANPGSRLAFDWRAGQGGPWPHDYGPVITYLASCGSTTCDKFDPSKGRWFKINEAGRRNNGVWVQDDLKKRRTLDFNLPENIAPGNYMLRQEIIALHLATEGKAEFYPACAQLKIGGNRNGVPKANELVTFPGAYKDSDPGIFAKNVFNTRVKYEMPGPKVASLVAGGVTQAPAPAPDVPAPAETTKAASTTAKANIPKETSAKPKPTSSTSTPKDNTGGKKCRQRKRDASPEPEAAPSPEQLYSEALARAEENATRRELGVSFARRHSKFVRMTKRSH